MEIWPVLQNDLLALCSMMLHRNYVRRHHLLGVTAHAKLLTRLVLGFPLYRTFKYGLRDFCQDYTTCGSISVVTVVQRTH